jgi:ACS family hexuronate transporter-like MFS transporter
MIGGVSGGWLSGYLIRRGWSVDRARKSVIVLGGLFMFPALLAIIGLDDPHFAITAIFIALFGFQCSIGVIQTLPSDFLSGKAVGTLAGLGGFSANLGVLISTWMVPMITKTSYTPFFVMAAALVPLGIAAVYLFSGKIGSVKPPQPVH